MPRKQPTSTQKAYARERARIQRAVKRMEKAGFDVNFNLPAIPKKITAGSVRRLEKITTKSLGEKAEAIYLPTGELITYKQYKVLQRREQGRRRKQENEIKKKLASYPPEIRSLRQEIEARNAEYRRQRDREPKTLPISKIPEDWEIALSRAHEVFEQYEDRAARLALDSLNRYQRIYGKEQTGRMLMNAFESGIIVEPEDSYNMGKIYRMTYKLTELLDMDYEQKKAFIDALADDDYIEGDMFM